VIAFNNKKLKKMIENKIHHPYLEQYITKPFIDLDKIATLLMIYDEVAVSQHKKYEQIVSVMLVQIALDTHELVTNESESLTDDLERQLSVLAGDFYSGLYYKTLADIEEIALVRTLANAIKQINEQKMILYQYEINDWHQLMDVIKAIESILFTCVGRLYQISDVHLQYISECLLVNRLLKEIESIERNNFSYIQQYSKRNLINLYEPSIVYSIEREIECRQEKLNALKNEHAFSFGQLNNIIFDKKMLSAVEEG